MTKRVSYFHFSVKLDLNKTHSFASELIDTMSLGALAHSTPDLFKFYLFQKLPAFITRSEGSATPCQRTYPVRGDSGGDCRLDRAKKLANNDG